MDLMVDPVRQRLTGAHGDEWTRYVRRAKFLSWKKTGVLKQRNPAGLITRR